MKIILLLISLLAPLTLAYANDSIENTALNLQHQFMEHDSIKHLQKAGLKKGQIVWDIGCGNGVMTLHLAKSVGPSGHVYALDASKDNLLLTENLIKKHNLKNVTLIHGDLHNISALPHQKADLIYSRLIFMHLHNPKQALSNIKNILKPNGILSIQEPALSQFHASAHIPGLDEFQNSILLLGQHLGHNYDLGKSISNLCSTSGFHIISSQPISHILNAKTASQLIKLRLSILGPKMIQNNIISQSQLNTWSSIPQQPPFSDPNFSLNPGNMFFILAKKS